MRRRALLSLSCLLVTAFCLLSATLGEALADTAGTVHFERMADSSFDQYTQNPSAATQAWLRAHMWRMGVWAPYFDDKTSWYPNAWVYDDAYAVYNGSQLASEHPEWILKDDSGQPLYIPYACSGGTCPQYAGDIGDPAYRQYWIDDLKSKLAHGYKGVFVDDVNMDLRVSDGNGDAVTPINSNTGQPMTAAVWRGYMADFMAEIRAQLPSSYEIVHNVIWYAGDHAGTNNAAIKKEVSSADFINVERGLNDSGLTGGSGQWSVNALLGFVDQVHALGKQVVLDGTASTDAGLQYNLAGYFLVSDGGDAVAGSGQTPASWWSGFDVNLGTASTNRYGWNGLLRRDFSAGMVLLNPPGAGTVTVALPSKMLTTSGDTVTSVTLAPASAAILRGAGTAPPSGSGTGTGSRHGRRAHTRTVLRGRLLYLRRPARSAPHARTARRGRAAGPGPRGLAPRRQLVARVNGQVQGATGGRVRILLERRTAKGWTTIRRATRDVGAAGRFARTFVLTRRDRYRMRATFAGTGQVSPSRSRFRPLAFRHQRRA